MTSAPWWIEWSDGGTISRARVDRVQTIGRDLAQADIVIRDPYISRAHCTVQPTSNGLAVEVREGALNPIRVSGTDHQAVRLGAGDTFVLGQTTFRVTTGGDQASTLRLPATGADLILRVSTRELIDREGTLIARFSPDEFAAFRAVTDAYPDAANHGVIAAAVWPGQGFDQYLIHRVMQRVRQRLEDRQSLIENVRGAGYRLRSPIFVL